MYIYMQEKNTNGKEKIPYVNSGGQSNKLNEMVGGSLDSIRFL
jgi:hypothetical protein